MSSSKVLLCMSIASLTFGLSSLSLSQTFTEALTQGTASGNINIRYESVDQDNLLDDASALTMRSRFAYLTGEANGFSARIEFEDVRVLAGVDDYSVPPTGFQTGQYSVIADPETTELDQGFLQYKTGSFTAKVGRQVITLDNHRFVGHVGWRQDRQTFDGLTFNLKPVENLSLNYNYIGQRERIFAQAQDIDTNDHLFNGAYKTSIGSIVAYAYLLETDNDTDNALDTTGLSFNGNKAKFMYGIEYARQSFKAGSVEADADYLMGKLGYNFGPVVIDATYEVLGSDDGSYGFATPLATLHKFNGWTDQFLSTPTTGLHDLSMSIAGKLGKGNWKIIYHDFSADESGPADDLGDEINAVYKMKFANHYTFGIKGGVYSAGDSAANKVDTTKLWLWVGASF